MKAFVNIAMPNGSMYQIPSFVIFNNYVAFRMSGGTTEDDAKKDAVERLSDPYGLTDWLKNNMNWSDVAGFARLTAFRTQDMEAQFLAAPAQATDEPSPPIDISRGDVFAYPLEAVIANLSASGQVATALVFTDETPGADNQLALTLVQGPASIVHGYLAVQQNFTDYLRDQANAAAAQLDAEQGTHLPTTDASKAN